MPFTRTESKDDLLTINGWRLEIQGQVIDSITQVGGLQRQVGNIEWVDGGTGNTEHFSDQKKDYGPISITYRVDPTKGEQDQLEAFVDACINQGTRFDFVIVKLNHGIEHARYLVYQGLFRSESGSDLDKNGSGPYEVTLEVPCTFWERVPV